MQYVSNDNLFDLLPNELVNKQIFRPHFERTERTRCSVMFVRSWRLVISTFCYCSIHTIAVVNFSELEGLSLKPKPVMTNAWIVIDLFKL